MLDRLRHISRKSALKVFLGGGIGYSFFKAASSPSSSLHKKLPEERIKNLEVFPYLKISRKDKVLHIHHWLYLSLLYTLLFLKKRGLLRSRIINGLLLGGILQGLSYKDRFHIVERTAAGDLHEHLKH